MYKLYAVKIRSKSWESGAGKADKKVLEIEPVQNENSRLGDFEHQL